MIAGVDAKFGKVLYELRAPFAEALKQLDALPDVNVDQLSERERGEGFAEARIWFGGQPPLAQAVPAGGKPVLGRVLLGQSHWRLEAFGAQRLAELRGRFEAQMAERARFCGERLDDLGALMAAKEPALDNRLVPPRLIEHPQELIMASSLAPRPPRDFPRATRKRGS
jgi:hypothetical protein